MARYSLSRPQLAGFQPSQEEANIAASLAATDPATAGLLLSGARNRGMGARMNYSLATQQANEMAAQEAALDRQLQMRNQNYDLLGRIAANPSSAALIGDAAYSLGVDQSLAAEHSSAGLAGQRAKALADTGSGTYSLRQAGVLPTGVDASGAATGWNLGNPLAIDLENIEQAGANGRTAMTQAGQDRRQASRQATTAATGDKMEVEASKEGGRVERATLNALTSAYKASVGNINAGIPDDVMAGFQQQAVHAGSEARARFRSGSGPRISAAGGGPDLGEQSGSPVAGASRAHEQPEATPTASSRTDPTQSVNAKVQDIQRRGGQVQGVNKQTGQVVYTMNGKQIVE